MPVNYDEVLKDMDEQEAMLLSDLAALKAARPAIVQLKKKAQAASLQIAHTSNTGRFTGIGATKAIPILLEGKPLMTALEVLEGLRAEGWVTRSTDPLSVVASTLGQLKDCVERIEDRYRLKEPMTFIISNPFKEEMTSFGAYSTEQ